MKDNNKGINKGRGGVENNNNPMDTNRDGIYVTRSDDDDNDSDEYTGDGLFIERTDSKSSMSIISLSSWFKSPSFSAPASAVTAATTTTLHHGSSKSLKTTASKSRKAPSSLSSTSSSPPLSLSSPSSMEDTRHMRLGTIPAPAPVQRRQHGVMDHNRNNKEDSSSDRVFKVEGDDAIEYVREVILKDRQPPSSPPPPQLPKRDFGAMKRQQPNLTRANSCSSSDALIHVPAVTTKMTRTSSGRLRNSYQGKRRSKSLNDSNTTIARGNLRRVLRNSQITTDTTVTNSFVISTIREAPPPVFRQYIHDRVHGQSFVPRFDRDGFKVINKKKDKKKKTMMTTTKKDTDQEQESKSSSASSSSSSSDESLHDEGDLDDDKAATNDDDKNLEYPSDVFMINGDNVSRVFRSIHSFADSDRPERLDEEEDPTDCMNRPPHFLCYLPPCVAKWPGLLEQNQFCEFVGRIGLHRGFKNQRIARRRIFAIGFTFNLFSLILLGVASMSISRQQDILTKTSFARGIATIPNHPPFFYRPSKHNNNSLYDYETDYTHISTLYMGFRALTSDDGILAPPDSVLFTTFCRDHGLLSVNSGNRRRRSSNSQPNKADESRGAPRTQQEAFQDAMAPEICGSCSQSSQGFVVSCVFNCIFIVKNMFSDITRMYPKYDLNCPNFAGSLMATLSVFLGLYTILSYKSRCFTALTKDLSDFGYVETGEDGIILSLDNTTLFMIPQHLRDNWAGHESEINVHLEWETGPGLWCMWLATGLKIVDAICNYIVPTPSITRDYQRREDYEYEFGEPGKFILEDVVDADDMDDEDDIEQGPAGLVREVVDVVVDDSGDGYSNFYDARDEVSGDFVLQKDPSSSSMEIDTRIPPGVVVVENLPSTTNNNYNHRMNELDVAYSSSDDDHPPRRPPPDGGGDGQPMILALDSDVEEDLEDEPEDYGGVNSNINNKDPIPTRRQVHDPVVSLELETTRTTVTDELYYDDNNSNSDVIIREYSIAPVDHHGQRMQLVGNSLGAEPVSPEVQRRRILQECDELCGYPSPKNDDGGGIAAATESAGQQHHHHELDENASRVILMDQQQQQQRPPNREEEYQEEQQDDFYREHHGTKVAI